MRKNDFKTATKYLLIFFALVSAASFAQSILKRQLDKARLELLSQEIREQQALVKFIRDELDLNCEFKNLSCRGK